MTYTIRMVRLKQFIEHGLGVSTYLDFGPRLFSSQWPPYCAHILQDLICNNHTFNFAKPIQILFIVLAAENLSTYDKVQMFDPFQDRNPHFFGTVSLSWFVMKSISKTYSFNLFWSKPLQNFFWRTFLNFCRFLE